MGRYNDNINLAKAMQNHASSTVPFDLADLMNPVPASLYFNQREDCFGKQSSHCTIIEDDTYRPVLHIKDAAFLRLFPEYFDCGKPILLDPPIALKPLTSVTIQEA